MNAKRNAIEMNCLIIAKSVKSLRMVVDLQFMKKAIFDGMGYILIEPKEIFCMLIHS